MLQLSIMTEQQKQHIPWDDDVDVWMPRADYEKTGTDCKQRNGYTVPRHEFFIIQRVSHWHTESWYTPERVLWSTWQELWIPVFSSTFSRLTDCRKKIHRGDRHWKSYCFWKSQRMNTTALKKETKSFAKWCKWAIRKCYGKRADSARDGKRVQKVPRGGLKVGGLPVRRLPQVGRDSQTAIEEIIAPSV